MTPYFELIEIPILEIKKNIKRTFKSRYGGKVKLLKK
jgi:hypothetical protein